MREKITPNEIKFELPKPEDINIEKTRGIPEWEDAYKKIKRALSIKKEGYNLYLIDTFSNDNIKSLMSFIEEEYKKLDSPKDICYVTLEDENKPEVIFVANGRGKKLKETVSNIKSSYLEVIDDFYSDSTNEEKDFLVEEVENKRNDYLNELISMAKDEGFEVKATSRGFAFMPLNGEEGAMTEKEYDSLEENHKDIIVAKAGVLKKRAEVILEELREIELKSIKRLKKLYSKFLSNKMEEFKDDALLEFITDDDSYEYLERLFTCIEEDIINCYTMSIEDDETEIYRIINKYDVKVIVDNTNNFFPPVIFEEDPNLNNLIGNIEYENHNGIYTTNLSLITAGALLKANEGCLIVRLNSLIINPSSYYYLKKILLSNYLTFESNKNYLEFININGLKPKPIPIKVKVILIGDYEAYDILYNSDEDFKKLFPLKAEIPDVVEMTDGSINTLKNMIQKRVKNGEINSFDDDAINELIKYLCRKCSSKKNIVMEDYTIDRALQIASDYSKERGDTVITAEDVVNAAYEKDLIEKEFIDLYKDNKILISLNDKKIGAINALAVLDTGYYTFGRPMRITCVAYKGTGRIIDIQKESNLSGKIHEKSINILKGLLSNILNPYEEIPIDFHICFEQTYGMVDGDSASIAEIVALLSALAKRGIKQNIAVTGSVNQFGEVQAIGGVNEKIEGFYNVCKLIDTIEGKGVIIPYSNKDEVILNPEVEKAVCEGSFDIYTMKNINDAIEVLILEENETLEEFYEVIKEEVSKYKTKKVD